LRNEDNNVTIGDVSDAIISHWIFNELLPARWIRSYSVSYLYFKTTVIYLLMKEQKERREE